jgi:hypothetical protein
VTQNELSGPVDGDFDHLANRLAEISEELDQIAFDQLREAAANGEVERPRDDKQLMQARRAIDKAVHILRSQSD